MVRSKREPEYRHVSDEQRPNKTLRASVTAPAFLSQSHDWKLFSSRSIPYFHLSYPPEETKKWSLSTYDFQSTTLICSSHPFPLKSKSYLKPSEIPPNNQFDTPNVRRVISNCEKIKTQLVKNYLKSPTMEKNSNEGEQGRKKVKKEQENQIMRSSFDSLPSDLFHLLLSFLGATSSSLLCLSAVNRRHHSMMCIVGESMLASASFKFLELPPPLSENESHLSQFIRHARRCHSVNNKLERLQIFLEKNRKSKKRGIDQQFVSERDVDTALELAHELMSLSYGSDNSDSTVPSGNSRRTTNMTSKSTPFVAQNWTPPSQAPSCSTALEIRVLALCGRVGGKVFKHAKSCLSQLQQQSLQQRNAGTSNSIVPQRTAGAASLLAQRHSIGESGSNRRINGMSYASHQDDAQINDHDRNTSNNVYVNRSISQRRYHIEVHDKIEEWLRQSRYIMQLVVFRHLHKSRQSQLIRMKNDNDSQSHQSINHRSDDHEKLLQPSPSS